MTSFRLKVHCLNVLTILLCYIFRVQGYNFLYRASVLPPFSFSCWLAQEPGQSSLSQYSYRSLRPAYFSKLKMEASGSFEMLATTYLTTCHHTSQDSGFHLIFHSLHNLPRCYKRGSESSHVCRMDEESLSTSEPTFNVLLLRLP